MANSGKNDSATPGKGTPEVRLRGFGKKATEPAAAIPVAPEQRGANASPVRFRARVEETPPSPAPAVIETVTPDVLSDTELSGTAVEAFDEAGVESAVVEEPVVIADSVPAAASTSAGGVRVRMPAKDANCEPRPVSTEAGKARDPEPRSSRSGNPGDPASKYVPDTDEERINRRQWWKYDLRVKSGRVQPQGGR
jgi:hypothetical protein